jgi:hypothetical protein
MKRLLQPFGLSMTLVSLTASVLHGQTPDYRFGGLAWGSTPSEVRAAFTAQGFLFVKVDEDRDYDFEGKVLGYETKIYAYMASGRLVKVQAMLATPDEDCFRAYHQMVDLLTKKYGPPSREGENYDSPYERGDGYEQTAVRVGKAHITSIWLTDTDETDKGGLWITISKKLTVNVHYEGPHWAAELAQRQSKSTKAF